MEAKLVRELNEALYLKFFTTPELNDRGTIKPVSVYMESAKEIINDVCFENLNEFIREEIESAEVKKYICSIIFWLHYFHFQMLIANSKIDKLTFWKNLSSAITNAKNNEPIEY